MKRKQSIRILSIILSVLLIMGFMPGLGADRVYAGDDTVLTLDAKTINEKMKAGYYAGDGWTIYDGGALIINKNAEILLNEPLTLSNLICEGNLTINGTNKLTVKSGEFRAYGNLIFNGATIEASGHGIWSRGDLQITNGSNVSVSGNKENVNEVKHFCNAICSNKKLTISASYVRASVLENSYDNISARDGIDIIDGSYIKTPNGGETKNSDIGYSERYYILDSEGNIPDLIEIEVKKSTPASTPDITPTKENTDNSSGKKNYKNEWVDGQWYDANGKTDYKYKGGWKKDSIGWWYEDENGWFPTARWQKIDGDWYYFDDIGYMASNEYAGNWTAYSEGYWWVGEDGAWDGSEPGVWRLSGTKWWFKDSTGWYAKGKWYKIGGTWYEFDADGWWIEK